MKELPVGIQDFRSLIEEDYTYVDKTELIYQLVSKAGMAYFLSRPRRFGKSLLVSTLASLFSGEKDLFRGTWIAQSPYEWSTHPVISLDLSALDSDSPQQLKDSLNRYLLRIARQLDIDIAAQPLPSETLFDLVHALPDKVVLLIDEYDSPLVDNLGNPKLIAANRRELQRFFRIIKTLQSQLQFVLLTGVSRFSKVSLFSGLNSLTDISLDPNYSHLLGLTEPEIRETLAHHVGRVAQQEQVGAEDILQRARFWYNGYLFSRSNEVERVYNPWSLFNYLASGNLENHWFETGTPTFAIQMIQERSYPILDLDGGVKAGSEIDRNYDIENVGLVSLLFQTGYLTIESYDPRSRTYDLKFPNEEVRRSLLENLFDSLTKGKSLRKEELFDQLRNALANDDIDSLMHSFNQLLAAIPFHLHSPQERYYHSLFYLCLRMLGFAVEAELSTSRGRIDLIAQTPQTLYLFEFKIDRSAQEALDQIRQNGYADRFEADTRPLVLIGANFSSQTRSIDDWIRQMLSKR